jgi:hypothetical protein
MDPVSGIKYGGEIIHANYSHSLVGVLMIALIAGIMARRAWGRRTGYIIAGVVFSHWVLDLLVHRADLPILPCNLGHLPLLGFGLWRWPAVSMTLESLLILAGILLYVPSVLSRAKQIPLSQKIGPATRRAVTAGTVMSVLLILAMLTDALGIA